VSLAVLPNTKEPIAKKKEMKKGRTFFPSPFLS